MTGHYRRALAAIVAASVLSSAGWILEGEAVARIPPLAVICSSLLVGGCCLLAMAHLTDRRGFSGFRSMSSRERLSFVAFSILRSSICSLLFACALFMSSSSKAMFLTKIEPYVVLLLQVVVYRHRTTAAHLALLAVHIVGAVLLSTGGQFQLSTEVRGDVLILVGICLNALTYGPAQRYARDLGAMRASGCSQLVGGALLIPFMVTFCPEPILAPSLYAVGWGYTFATVAVFYVFSTALWFYSLKEIPAWLASALRCVGPVVAAPIAWIVFGQTLTAIQVFGAAIVIVTSAWMVRLER